jgi:hypothetical protein
MKFSILFFVVLVGFVAPMVSALLGPGFARYEQTLDVNQTFSAPMGQLPLRPQGPVTVSISTTNSVEICLQEYVVIQGDLESCNPGGYFLINLNSTSQANFFSLDEESIGSLFGGEYGTNFVGDETKTEVVTTSLRGGSYYYISARIVGALVNETANFAIDVNWNPTSCASGQIGVGNQGCTTVNSTILSTVKEYSVDALTSQIFSVVLSSDDNSYLHTTVTPLSNPSIYRTNAAASNSSINASMDVEIRRQAVPENGLFDANATLENGAYVVDIDSPVPNTTYYILVTNNENSAISYNLESIAQTCGAGLFGPNCTSAVVDLTHVQNATKYTGNAEYQYFYVSSSTLVVGTGTEKLDGPAPTLLASIFNYPSNETALLVSYNKTVNFISAHNPSGGAGAKWYISVWANDGEDYYIWANIPCPNNCSGVNGGNSTHGTCDVDTGMCDCSKGYGDLFCDKSGLKLVWIIIIVIVCAIILAVAIGVPVACFLRNRRRARYERV